MGRTVSNEADARLDERSRLDSRRTRAGRDSKSQKRARLSPCAEVMGNDHEQQSNHQPIT
jgi:hypothetical protein